MSGPAPRRLAVLLASYNGAAWLRPQLDSIAGQTLRPDLILVSDDASEDDTGAVLEEFAIRHPSLPLVRLDGPGQGSAGNFLSLIRRTPEDVERLSFSDQDDVWLPAKLERAMARLDAFDRGEDSSGPAGAEIPALYCSRILICDYTLTRRVPSQLPRRAPSFRNALTQNIATGHTIVLNAAATRLIRSAAARTGALVVHDWWLYQIVTGAGGRILLDPEAHVLYRQHEGNLIGANTGPLARLLRIGQLLSGVYGDWNTINLAALMAVRELLTPENAALVEAFAAARRAGPWGRVRVIRRLGLYRQGRVGQASLYAAAALGKF